MFNTVKEAYDKYIVMDNRLNTLENKISQLEDIIKENEHSGRICPKCSKKSLQFDYVEGVGGYFGHKATCPECGYATVDQEFIKHCLHRL